MEIVWKIINGPVLIAPKIFKDDRGYFYESFNEADFKINVADVDFVQDNQSVSSYGVLRGMHCQTDDSAQAKLVRVVKGAVIDVVVDARKDSLFFGEVYHAYLSEHNHRQFFVPRGFLHGFLSLEENTVFQYKCDNYYDKDSERSFNYRTIFDWSAYVDPACIKVSEKDDAAPYFDFMKMKRRLILHDENQNDSIK